MQVPQRAHFSRVVEQIGFGADEFRIAAPQAAQRAAFKENGAADARAVFGGVSLDGRDRSQVRIV